MANVGSQPPTQAVSKPPSGKHGNVLPLWGNEKTMNLNPMILTNVLSSPYFKVQLYELKTYHEVVDEIYFKVTLADAKPHATSVIGEARNLPQSTKIGLLFSLCENLPFLVLTHGF